MSENVTIATKRLRLTPICSSIYASSIIVTIVRYIVHSDSPCYYSTKFVTTLPISYVRDKIYGWVNSCSFCALCIASGRETHYSKH